MVSGYVGKSGTSSSMRDDGFVAVLVGVVVVMRMRMWMHM